MSRREITLWLDERWYQALSQQLEVRALEEKLNEYLDDLISLLPTDVYDKIMEEIKAESQQRELPASQKYAAFRVTENGVTEYFRLNRAVDMLDAATPVRRWLRQTEQRPFQELLPDRMAISAEEFDRMAVGYVEGSPEVTGVYDVNLDRREFSTVQPDPGWITYRLEDISIASWHSYRTGSYDRERRQARFMEKLIGREIVSADHLSAENFSFADEMAEDVQETGGPQNQAGQIHGPEMGM